MHAERDPEFREKALQKLDKDNTLIVYCQVGGTLKTGNARPDGLKEFKDDPERAFGRESRSLKACFELQEVPPCTLECPYDVDITSNVDQVSLSKAVLLTSAQDPCIVCSGLSLQMITVYYFQIYVSMLNLDNILPLDIATRDIMILPS